jgi:ABC-type transporter Mla subunit MlaD
MIKNVIVWEIYKVITTAPEILTRPFIEELLKTVLPLAESDADDKVVKEAINNLYRNFTEVRDRIRDVTKNLDDAKPEVTPGYETLINTYRDIKKLEASLKKRIDKANAKN